MFIKKGFIYSKKSFSGPAKIVQISRVFTKEGCSDREVLLYLYVIGLGGLEVSLDNRTAGLEEALYNRARGVTSICML